MAITTSRAGVVIDALVAKCKASATFADPVRVYDGPGLPTDTEWTNAVYIGFAGDFAAYQQGQYSEAVLINQAGYRLGNTSVPETLEVACVAEGWSGDQNPQTARNGCLTLLSGVETIIRTDPTLGVDGSTTASLQVGNLAYLLYTDGIACHIPFTVHVTTYLITV